MEHFDSRNSGHSSSTLSSSQNTSKFFAFTVKEKNIFYLEDERHTEYIDRAEKDGLIITRRISNISNEGEK